MREATQVVVVAAILMCAGCGGDGEVAVDAMPDATTDGGGQATPRRLVIPRVRASASAAGAPSDSVTTIIRAIYGRPPGATSTARVEVTLFDADGSVLTGTGGAVCDPCDADLGATGRALAIDAQAMAAGVGLLGPLDGYAVVRVTGEDPGAVAVSATTETLAEGSVSVILDTAQTVETTSAGPRRLFLGDGMDNTGGPTTTNGFDARLTILNVGDAGAATVALRLYGEGGALLPGGAAAVCDPCTFVVDSATPRTDTTIEALRTAAGATPGFVKFLGVMDVSGPGAADVVVIAELELGTAAPVVVSRSLIPVVAERIGATPATLRFVTPRFTDGPTQAEFLSVVSFAGLGTTSGPPGGPTAQVSHHVLDDTTGTYMLGQSGEPFCDPCTLTLGDSAHASTASIFTLSEPEGGTSGPRTGVVITEVTGTATPGVFASVTSAGFTPQIESRQALPDESEPLVRVFVLPHVLESSGRIIDTQFAFDTSVFVTYTAGLGGVPTGPGATVDLYLFDPEGEPLLGASRVVCDPCTLQVGTDAPGGAAPRKRVVVVDEMIMAAGGFPTSIMSGFGVFVITGDADNVSLQGFVVNARSGPLDLSVFGFEPQPIAAAP